MTHPSLRRSLLFRLIGLMVVFSIGASFLAYKLSLKFSDDAYDQWLQDSARSLSQLIQVRNGHVEVDLPANTLKAVIWDAYDKVYFRVDSKEGFIAGQPILPRHYPMTGDEVMFFDLIAEGQSMRAVQVNRHDLIPGETVSITMAESLHKRQRLATRMLTTVLAISVALCLLTIVFARSAVTKGLRPLLKLAEVVRARHSGDLTRVPDAGIASELGVFTAAINELLGQLDAALQAQRRFVADAAHQLRTPLAALKVELEHALRESDPDKHDRALRNLKGGIDRMARLSNQLLTMARAEPGALASSHFKQIDLHAVVYQAAQAFVPKALAQGADLGFECTTGDAIWVRGDTLLLEELVNNLLDNALKYAGPAAQIDVLLAVTPSEALLTIQDNGPGVPASELQLLGQRFHRPPGSVAGGSGLGLAIVAEIVRTHEGRLAINTATPHGLVVAIHLPLVPQKAPPT